MIMLTKDNDYIVDRGDHYSIPILNINESLHIDLDKRLHVETTVFIAGDLQCNDIIVNDIIVVNGNVIASNIQANEIYFMRNSNIKENLVGRVNIQLGRSYIGGNIVSNGQMLCVADITCTGDVSVATGLIIRGNAKFGGNVVAYSVIDIHGKIELKGKMKMAGVEFDNYSRLSFGRFIYIITESVFVVSESNGIVEIFENKHDKYNELKNEKREYTNKEKAFLDIYQLSNNLEFPINSEW